MSRISERLAPTRVARFDALRIARHMRPMRAARNDAHLRERKYLFEPAADIINDFLDVGAHIRELVDAIDEENNLIAVQALQDLQQREIGRR